jgi:hypothetical protein
MVRRSPKLGDLVVFAMSPQPGEYGVVIGVDESTGMTNVLWPWGAIECSLSTFEGERWGNLRIITDEN